MLTLRTKSGSKLRVLQMLRAIRRGSAALCSLCSFAAKLIRVNLRPLTAERLRDLACLIAFSVRYGDRYPC